MLPVFRIEENAGKIVAAGKKQVPDSLRAHWHECFEVEIVLAGKGTQIINGIPYTIQPGDFYLLSPLDYHEIIADEPLAFYGIMFEEKLASYELIKWILSFEARRDALLISLSSENFDRVRNLFETVIHEELLLKKNIACPSFTHRFLGGLLDCILIELIRLLSEKNIVSDDEKILEAIHYVSQHFTEPISLSSIAEITHLNSSYLSRLFRRTTGQSFMQFVIELRLRYAGRLLATTKMSITEICLASGFRNYANFMRSFKEHFGISPNRFRQCNNQFLKEVR